MRKQLYELLRHNVCECPNCDECELCDDDNGCIAYMEYRMADFLVESGVTIPVRCKDCEYYGDTAYGDMCKRWEDWLPTEEDDFCSYGERRADNEL